MAITDLDSFISALLNSSQGGVAQKATVTPTVATQTYASLWAVTGMFPPAGSAPSNGGTSYDGGTSGGIQVAQTDSLLVRITYSSTNTHTMIPVDRLVGCGGLAFNTTSAQTVTLPALPRHTDGLGVMAFLEVYTPGAATVFNATISYTNEQGTSGRTGTAVGSAVATATYANQTIPFTLQEGDYGVRSVASVTLSAAGATAGEFAIILAKPCGVVGSDGVLSGGCTDSLFSSGGTVFREDTCLAFIRTCAAASVQGPHHAEVHIISLA